MAIAVLVGGILQFALCWAAVRQAGVKLHFGRPRMTPAVRELVVLILPATAAAGVYQISQLFYAYFSAGLGEGALTEAQLCRPAQPAAAVDHRHRARRRHPAGDQPGDRPRRRSRSVGRPGASVRSVDAAHPARDAGAGRWPPGRSSARSIRAANISVEDARVTGNILAILVTGLPAYVLVKVLTPAFYARKDVKTPVWIAMGVLVGGIVANFILIPFMGIYAWRPSPRPAPGSISACCSSSSTPAANSECRAGWSAACRKQLIAALAMGASLYAVKLAAG